MELNLIHPFKSLHANVGLTTFVCAHYVQRTHLHKFIHFLLNYSYKNLERCTYKCKSKCT